MKATPSVDGLLRFNLTIKVRCSLDDIINSLLWHKIRDGKEPKTRREALGIAKQAMKAAGQGLWADVEEATKEEQYWATDIAFRLFPELKPKTKS